MRAVVIPSFGDPGVLEVRDVDVRDAGPGEVRIRVAYAAVNPTDIATRSGLVAKAYEQFDPPYIAGMDAAGVVESVGPGVEDLAVGDPVMAIVMPRREEGGAHAELIVGPAAAAVRAPAGITTQEAAMLPMNGLTAMEALHVLDVPAGGTLAITGGAGFLAAFTTVLAKRAGLRVLADARPDEQEDVRARGADVVVDRGPGVAERFLAEAPGGVDAVLDTATIGPDLFACLKDGGAFGVVRGYGGPTERGIVTREVWVRARLEDTAGLRTLSALADEGAFDFLDVVASVRPEDAATAHELVEAGGLRGRPLIAF
jgi:NADPH:quinone reductase-like Zn-dependent oxidoreductase